MKPGAPCEYCTFGKLVRRRSVMGQQQHGYSEPVPVYINVLRCDGCHREPSQVCPSCGLRTRPCGFCLAQACGCPATRIVENRRRLHWYGGVPNGRIMVEPVLAPRPEPRDDGAIRVRRMTLEEMERLDGRNADPRFRRS